MAPILANDPPAATPSGTIRPLVDRRLLLGEAADAHRLIASGRVHGNLVLLPWSD